MKLYLFIFNLYLFLLNNFIICENKTVIYDNYLTNKTLKLNLLNENSTTIRLESLLLDNVDDDLSDLLLNDDNLLNKTINYVLKYRLNDDNGDKLLLNSTNLTRRFVFNVEHLHPSTQYTLDLHLFANEQSINSSINFKTYDNCNCKTENTLEINSNCSSKCICKPCYDDHSCDKCSKQCYMNKKSRTCEPCDCKKANLLNDECRLKCKTMCKYNSTACGDCTLDSIKLINGYCLPLSCSCNNETHLNEGCMGYCIECYNNKNTSTSNSCKLCTHNNCTVISSAKISKLPATENGHHLNNLVDEQQNNNNSSSFINNNKLLLFSLSIFLFLFLLIFTIYVTNLLINKYKNNRHEQINNNENDIHINNNNNNNNYYMSRDQDDDNNDTKLSKFIRSCRKRVDFFVLRYFNKTIIFNNNCNLNNNGFNCTSLKQLFDNSNEDRLNLTENQVIDDSFMNLTNDDDFFVTNNHQPYRTLTITS